MQEKEIEVDFDDLKVGDYVDVKGVTNPQRVAYVGSLVICTSIFTEPEEAFLASVCGEYYTLRCRFNLYRDRFIRGWRYETVAQLPTDEGFWQDDQGHQFFLTKDGYFYEFDDGKIFSRPCWYMDGLGSKSWTCLELTEADD